MPASNAAHANTCLKVSMSIAEEHEKVVITCDTEEQKVKFTTNGNDIDKMEIYLKYECDLDEVQSKQELFTIERFNKFQQMVEEIVKKEVENIMNKIKRVLVIMKLDM